MSVMKPDISQTRRGSVATLAPHWLEGHLHNSNKNENSSYILLSVSSIFEALMLDSGLSKAQGSQNRGE